MLLRGSSIENGAAPISLISLRIMVFLEWTGWEAFCGCTPQVGSRSVSFVTEVYWLRERPLSVVFVSINFM